jgi:hypothetical protein
VSCPSTPRIAFLGSLLLLVKGIGRAERTKLPRWRDVNPAGRGLESYWGHIPAE